jgi:TRAP-type C4-dicarboxylate transport system permease large subunit
LPFLAVSLLVLVLVSLFPELSLFLPKLIMD